MNCNKTIVAGDPVSISVLVGMPFTLISANTEGSFVHTDVMRLDFRIRCNPYSDIVGMFLHSWEADYTMVMKDLVINFSVSGGCA